MSSPFRLTREGSAECALLISGFGDRSTGGGLFSFDGAAMGRIDWLSSTGMALADGLFLRLLRAPEDKQAAGELLVYDEKGIQRYYRIDALADPHDILWDGAYFVAVSTLTNSILWISPDGKVARVWKAPGEGDAWHINSLFRGESELIISAFGRSEKHREWVETAERPTGFVAGLSTGRELIQGLHQPHHPRLVDGALLVCNSCRSELIEFDPALQSVRRRLPLRGYTRGLAVSDDYLLVGESANRKDPSSAGTSSVAIVSRRDWTVVERLELPCQEIYDLVLVDSPALLEGIRRGFRTNSTRAAEQDQYLLFQRAGVEPVRLWAISEPLPPEACKVRMEASLPSEMRPGERLEVECLLENKGGAILVGTAPYQVHLSYKWVDPASGERLAGTEGLRTALPRPLPPGQVERCRVKVQAPPLEGHFALRLTLVQENVAWFDDLDPANACEALVRVMPLDRLDRD